MLATDVIFSSAGVSGGGESASLRATANLRVLYLDENAVPLLSERRSEVLLETDLPAGGQARVQDVYAGEIAASVGADGVELRFPVTFAVSVAETPCYPCLQSLEAEECGKKDENVPSLVLRAMKQGERLWDIAKLSDHRGGFLLELVGRKDGLDRRAVQLGNIPQPLALLPRSCSAR